MPQNSPFLVFCGITLNSLLSFPPSRDNPSGRSKFLAEVTIDKYMRAADRRLSTPSLSATGRLTTKEALRAFLLKEEGWRLLLELLLPAKSGRLKVERAAINLLLVWVGLEWGNKEGGGGLQ